MFTSSILLSFSNFLMNTFYLSYKRPNVNYFNENLVFVLVDWLEDIKCRCGLSTLILIKFFIFRNLDVFTVNTHHAPPSAPITAQWTAEQTIPLHPPTRSSQPNTRPNSGNSDKTGESTLPPYTPPQGVYDPNAADELKDWDERNN